MKNIMNKMKKYSLSFITLNIYLVLLFFLPKSISSIGPIPIRLAATVLISLIFIYDIYKKKVEVKRSQNNIITFVFLLFIVSTIPSLFVSKALITSIYTILKFVFIYLMFYLISKIKFSKEEYKILIINLIISLSILCIYGIMEYVFEINLFTAGVEFYKGARGRITTTFFNTIYYGIFINLAFPISFYLMCKFRKNKFSWLLALLCCLLYINLLLTFTRSAIIIFTLILILSIVLLYKIAFNKKTLSVVVVIVAFTLLLPGGKPFITKSFDDVLIMTSNVQNILGLLPSGEIKEPSEDKESEFVDPSLQHREEFAKIAKKISDDNKFTGVGFGAYIDYMDSEDFAKTYSDYNLPHTHPHSTFVLLYAECGITALIIFTIFIAILFINGFSIFLNNFKKKNTQYELSIISLALVCGFLLVNIMAENAFYDSQIFPLFLIFYSLIIGYIQSLNNKKVLFISSTGGHLSELLQLKPLFKKYNSYLITEKTKSTVGLKEKYESVNYLVYGTKDHKFSYIFKFTYNIIKSFILYLKIRPEVIVTTGTHTAVPICYIGKLLGSKIIFIETFANSKTKTLSGKLIYPIANTFVVQWKEMLELYPKAIYAGWIY